MSKILQTAQAGTLESNDIVIAVAPGKRGDGIVIELSSIVALQFGDAIKKVIIETLTEQGIRDVTVKATDRGAMDCTIRARMLAVLVRAGAVLKGESL